MITSDFDLKCAKQVPGFKNAWGAVSELYGPVEPYVAWLMGRITFTQYKDHRRRIKLEERKQTVMGKLLPFGGPSYWEREDFNSNFKLEPMMQQMPKRETQPVGVPLDHMVVVDGTVVKRCGLTLFTRERAAQLAQEFDRAKSVLIAKVVGRLQEVRTVNVVWAEEPVTIPLQVHDEVVG